MGGIEKPTIWRAFAWGVVLATSGCAGTSGLKTSGDPLLGDLRSVPGNRGPTPVPLVSRPTSAPSQSGAFTSNPDPLMGAMNNSPGGFNSPQRTGAVPPLPNQLSAGSNVELTRNAQAPGQQSLQIPQGNPWMLTSQNRQPESSWNNAQGSASSAFPVPGTNPGGPRVIAVPLDASTSRSGGIRQSSWSNPEPPRPSFTMETLKSVLDSREVAFKTEAVPGGIKLIALVPDASNPGTSQLLETTAADARSALDALLPRIDQIQGKR